MTTYKSIKWSLGAIALVSLLSGCNMDRENYPQTNTGVSVQPVAPQPKIVEKNTGKPAPVQQVAPGPKRTAAPSLPVIQ